MSAYSIWVMEYAYVVKQPTSLFIYGAHNQGHRKMPYAYIVIKGHGRTMLVDVGYDHQAYGEVLAQSYGVENWHPPSEVLTEVGVAPGDVSTVFQTHAHFDHMGNINAFPNATFYIQERELSKWVWTMSLERRFRWLMLGIDPADIMRLVDLARQGRLVAVDGDRENVMPGIDLHAAFDSHTWGSQYVTVRNDLSVGSADSWVFSGDLVYSHENLRGTDPADPQYIPVGLATGSQFKLIMTSEEMVKRAGGDPMRVIPGHEEALKDLYPSRIAATGLRITELALADGESSRVR
ncbi:MAG: N-acyl homoserine lactonase family protein [Acidobacteriota bacterium]